MRCTLVQQRAQASSVIYRHDFRFEDDDKDDEPEYKDDEPE